MPTLIELINKLNSDLNLDKKIHFDVWICETDAQNKINKTMPSFCGHFYWDNVQNNTSDILIFANYNVKNYDFEILDHPKEYHLYVNLNTEDKKS